jgi:alpha-N-arabinofuranosidase
MSLRTWLAALVGVGSLLAGDVPPTVAFRQFVYTGRDDRAGDVLAQGQYRNPILAGFYPDPSICRVGDDYYLVNSTFGYFPGIPLFHSRDLVNWRQLGHVIDRPTQITYAGIGATRGLFAPALSHHGDTFYLVCTMIDGRGNFLVTAKDPAGPWSDPVWLHFDGIDPSLFFDDDGRAWLVNNGDAPDKKPLYPGHRAIWIQEFDPRTHQLIGPRSIIVNGGVDLSKKPVWIEGPHLYKRDGWYYLCCAEGGTSDQHSQVILRSRAVTGPFVPWAQNPILTQRDLDGTVPGAVTCTGHADLVEGPDGKWWSVFLGCRPFAGKYTFAGRETFLLPVKWTADGWPQILPPGERVPLTFKAPGRASPPDEPSPAARTPLNGNFTWTDDFTGAQLSPLWLTLRVPASGTYQQASDGLRLQPRADRLGGRGQPAFLARRVQHARFTASATLTPADSPKVSAGLALFQSEKQHFYAGVRRTETGLEFFVERADRGQTTVLARLTAPFEGEPVVIDAEVDELRLTFRYRVGNGPAQTLLADTNAEPLTVQAAGGGLHFTGAVVGPHARTESGGSDIP